MLALKFRIHKSKPFKSSISLEENHHAGDETSKKLLISIKMKFPFFSNESYDKCMEATIFDQLQAGPGCRVPWIRNNLSICETVSTLNQAKVLIGARNGICLKPCNFLMANTGIINFSSSEAESKLTLYFPRRVMQR